MLVYSDFYIATLYFTGPPFHYLQGHKQSQDLPSNYIREEQWFENAKEEGAV